MSGLPGVLTKTNLFLLLDRVLRGAAVKTLQNALISSWPVTRDKKNEYPVTKHTAVPNPVEHYLTIRTKKKYAWRQRYLADTLIISPDWTINSPLAEDRGPGKPTIAPVNTQFFSLTKNDIYRQVTDQTSESQQETALTTPDPKGEEALYNRSYDILSQKCQKQAWLAWPRSYSDYNLNLQSPERCSAVGSLRKIDRGIPGCYAQNSDVSPIGHSVMINRHNEQGLVESVQYPWQNSKCVSRNLIINDLP